MYLIPNLRDDTGNMLPVNSKEIEIHHNFLGRPVLEH